MELYVALTAGFLVIYLAIRSIDRKQTEIEQRMLLIFRHLGLLAETGSEPSAKVKSLAADRDRYIEALQTYRAETGSDLKQAQRAIESLQSPDGDA